MPCVFCSIASGDLPAHWVARGPDATWVQVVNSGFAGSRDEQVAAALDSTGGFALVLAGAKIWLEHGVEPGFVPSRHPDALVEGWR